MTTSQSYLGWIAAGIAFLWYASLGISLYRAGRRSACHGLPALARIDALPSVPGLARSIAARVYECRQLARILAEHEPAFLLRHPEVVDWMVSIDNVLTTVEAGMVSTGGDLDLTASVYDRLRAVVLSMAAQGSSGLGHDCAVDVERRRRVAAAFLVGGNEPVFSSIPAQYEGPTIMRRVGANGLYQDVVFGSVRQAHIAAALVASRDNVAPAEVELVPSPDADVDFETAAEWATH